MNLRGGTEPLKRFINSRSLEIFIIVQLPNPRLSRTQSGAEPEKRRRGWTPAAFGRAQVDRTIGR